MNWLTTIFGGTGAKIIDKVSDAIDALHLSEEEKFALQVQIENILTERLKETESTVRQSLEAQKEIIVAEAKGESWLQRNWRPLTMIWFSVLMGMHWFGMTPANLSEPVVLQMFNIIEVGLGGYVIGRSAEKIAPSVIEALKKK